MNNLNVSLFIWSEALINFHPHSQEWKFRGHRRPFFESLLRGVTGTNESMVRLWQVKRILQILLP